jgi:hypothetical protein
MRRAVLRMCRRRSCHLICSPSPASCERAPRAGPHAYFARNWLGDCGFGRDRICDHARIEMAGSCDTPRGILRIGFRNTLDPGFGCHGRDMVTGLLGSTGLVVSRIGFGLAALGRPAYISILDVEDDLGANRIVADLERRSHELLDAAYTAGIRYRRCGSLISNGRSIPGELAEDAMSIACRSDDRLQL